MHYLDKTRIDIALQNMHHDSFSYRDMLGLFGERFEYQEAYIEMLAFTSAYLGISAKETFDIIRHIDDISPIEFTFALAFLCYTYEHALHASFDGKALPKRSHKKHEGIELPIQLVTQFPLRISEYRRDVDFLLRIGFDEMGLELDGSFFHYSDKALKRDLAAETFMHALDVPMIRVSSTIIKHGVFSFIEQLIHASLAKPYHYNVVLPRYEQTFTYHLKMFDKPDCLHTFVAQTLDLFFQCRVAFSVSEKFQYDFVTDLPVHSAIEIKEAKSPYALTELTIKFQSLNAKIRITYEDILIQSESALASKMLVMGFISILERMSEDCFESYRYQIYECRSPGAPCTLLLSTLTDHVLSRIQFIQNRQFKSGNKLVEHINMLEPYNQRATRTYNEYEDCAEN